MKSLARFVVVWVLGAMCLFNTHAQDTNVALLMSERDSNREDIKRLSSTVEDLLAANLALQKKMVAMETEMREIRSELTQFKDSVKDSSSTYATQEQVQHLAEKAQEIDKKREADKKLILEELQKLLTIPPVTNTGSEPAPVKTTTSKPPQKTVDEDNSEYYSYTIKPKTA